MSGLRIANMPVTQGRPSRQALELQLRRSQRSDRSSAHSSYVVALWAVPPHKDLPVLGQHQEPTSTYEARVEVEQKNSD